MGKRDIHISGSSIAAFHTARYLLDHEYKVTMDGLQSPKFVDRLFMVRDVKNFKYFDLNNNFSLDEALKMNIQPAATIYFREETRSDLDNQFEDFRITVDSLKETAPESRFIFVSSDLVYGNVFDNDPITEERPLNPSTPEGVYYKKMEDYLKQSGLKRWTILRPAEVFGEGIFSKIHVFVQHTIAGEDYKVADNKRDFCYVTNLADIIMRCIQKAKNVNGEIYNVANGHPVRYLALGNALGAVLGNLKTENKKQTIEAINKVNIDDTITDMENIVVSIEKAKKKLKWEPIFNNIFTILTKKIIQFEIAYMADDELIKDERKVELLRKL